VADKHDLVKSPKIHSPAEHAHVLLAFDSIQRSHGFVPEQGLVANAFALPHVVDGDAQVDGFVYENELPARKLIHEVSTVHIFVADLDIKIVNHPLAVRPILHKRGSIPKGTTRRPGGERCMPPFTPHLERSEVEKKRA